MVTRKKNATCSHCGAACYQKPYLAAKGFRAFCSKKCLDNSRSETVETKCEECGASISQKPWAAKHRPRKFCNRSCASKSQRGMKYTKEGYRNKQQARMAMLKNTFDFSKCMVEECNYDKILVIHRFVPGNQGGKYAIGNMFAVCPNHHAEIHGGLATAEKISECVLKLESN